MLKNENWENHEALEETNLENQEFLEKANNEILKKQKFLDEAMITIDKLVATRTDPQRPTSK